MRLVTLSHVNCETLTLITVNSETLTLITVNSETLTLITVNSKTLTLINCILIYITWLQAHEISAERARFSAGQAHVNFSYKTAADWLDCAI